MKVYEIIHESNDYQTLVDDEDSTADENSLYSVGVGKVFDGDWIVPKLRIYNPKSKKPNFFSYISGSTVVDEVTCEKLQTIFEFSGELFPISCNEFNGYLLNILECVNCLDQKNCEFEKDDEGDILWVEKFAFQTTMLPESSLFKIPEAISSIFTIEGMGIRDEFKEVYEGNKMKGLKFELIWSDE
ncbi:MAG: hypothetical protein COA79_21315 [Planctomycetota bacterium]|nr:MAG: hypothetical protein COA79_21315 [Planctomycetota bacterium]